MDENFDFVQKIIPATKSDFIVNPGADPALLLHMDGTNTSTSFPDATSRHSVLANGNAQVTTAQFVFGQSAVFDGVNGTYLSLDGSNDFQFGTGDFTIDFRIRFNSYPPPGNLYVIYDPRPAGVSVYTGTQLHIDNYHGGTINLYVDNVSIIQTRTVIQTQRWYHVALTRSQSISRMFLDGSQEQGDLLDTNNYLNGGAGRPFIGSNSDVVQNSLDGWIDEFRILKGVAVWTTDFTPPTAPYTPP